MNNEAIPRSLFFLAGAASGLALGLYLHSENGRAFREQLGENWDKLLDSFGDQAQDQINLLLKNLNVFLEKGMELTESLEDQFTENVQSVGEEALDQLEAVENSFESGMEKARMELQRKLENAGLGPEYHLKT